LSELKFVKPQHCLDLFEIMQIYEIPRLIGGIPRLIYGITRLISEFHGVHPMFPRGGLASDVSKRRACVRCFQEAGLFPMFPRGGFVSDVVSPIQWCRCCFGVGCVWSGPRDAGLTVVIGCCLVRVLHDFGARFRCTISVHDFGARFRLRTCLATSRFVFVLNPPIKQKDRMRTKFIDQCDGTQLAQFSRSIFGLVKVWNVLRQVLWNRRKCARCNRM
jgi:hypothetical protein